MKRKNAYPIRYTLNFVIFCLIAALCSLFLILPILNFTLPQKGEEEVDRDALADTKVTFVIDAGHGGEDGGTVGNGLVEKDLNLDIALRLAARLKDSGAQVVTTRESDTMLYDKNSDYAGKKKALDLQARLEITEKCENPVFISIHMNYFPQTQYSGLQVYYSKNNVLSRSLAESIQNECRSVLQPDNNRTVKESTSAIFLLHNLPCPAVLVECGFLSNADEAKLLSDENYREKLAEVIFIGIKNYILHNNT